MAGSADYGTLAARVAAEDAALRAEEASLRALSAGVAQTKGVAAAVSDEVSSQNALLDDLEAGFARAHGAAERITASAAAVDRDPYTIKSFCGLLWPIVLLMLLALFWLKHLLFS